MEQEKEKCKKCGAVIKKEQKQHICDVTLSVQSVVSGHKSKTK